MRAERETSELPAVIPGVSEALLEKLGQFERSDRDIRYVLAGLDTLAYLLMECEFWTDAEIATKELSRLCLEHGEVFLLDDARLRQAVCLKRLGKMQEYRRAKAQVRAGTTILLGGDDWKVEDL